MTRIDIFSGFLGAGKTTLIKKLIKEAYVGEKLVLIENEFGEIGIDGGFLQDAGIEITEMNSGCICCSLVGDFSKALAKVLAEYNPDRVLIEPSGVGKLSDVVKAVKSVEGADFEIGCLTTVVDAGKCKMYMKNFGEFFGDQIRHATAVVLSHTDTAKQARIEDATALVRENNATATIIATPWDQLTGADILAAMEHKDTLDEAIRALEEEHHHHHHHDHDEHCECGCHDHEHHHHDHDEHCECGCHDHEHHHHHDHDEHCNCGCHDHDHHGHHHADEVFESFGVETARKFTAEEITAALEAFVEDDSYGMVLRAKGIVASTDGEWIHFDYVPGEPDVRRGTAGTLGRLCVIGSGLNKEKIKEIFGV